MPERLDRQRFLAELTELTPSEGWPLGQIIFTAAEASVYLGVRPVTLRKWVRQGRIVRHARNEYDMGSLLNAMVAEQTARRVDDAPGRE